jgi:hypothetical protein
MAISAADIRREKLRRAALKRRAWDPIAALDPQQVPFYLDSTRNRVLSGTRQGGKTRTFLTDAVQAGLDCPGSDSAYVDMDIEHGGKVAWTELRKMLAEFSIPSKITEDNLSFDNGSKLYIFSGQKTEKEKLQGLKYARLIIDESQELETISEILTLCGPALLRYNGRVCLGGIPGRIHGLGDWWDITEGKDAHLFGQHRIDFWHNPHLSEEAKVELYESEKERLGEFSPEFLRHWCGVWPATNNAMRVYHYNSDENGYDGDPPTCERYALGLDPGGVKDAEASVVVGHGNDDRNIYAVDEDVTEKKEGGDWDDTGDRVGPMQEKWNCHVRFYDWGSAHKDALTLIWKKDQQILMTGVPSKDPYEESKRINRLFATKKLWVKRGSKLEKDLLYTEWDPETLKDGGKPKYSKKWKQNAADALRCAMWAVWGFKPREKKRQVQLSDIEQEAQRVSSGAAYKDAQRAQRADKYRPPTLPAAFASRSPTLRRSPQVNKQGRVNRGY